MDLERFKLDELLLAALKSELEAREIYRELADMVNVAFMKDRLLFLSDEEDKHRAFLEKVWAKNFPKKPIKIPITTSVPLPEVRLGKDIPASDVFNQAMEAEMAAKEFYEGLAGRFKGDKAVRNGLEYLAAMELGHYRLLELEKEQLDRMEEGDAGWEMMHLGP